MAAINMCDHLTSYFLIIFYTMCSSFYGGNWKIFFLNLPGSTSPNKSGQKLGNDVKKCICEEPLNLGKVASLTSNFIQTDVHEVSSSICGGF